MAGGEPQVRREASGSTRKTVGHARAWVSCSCQGSAQNCQSTSHADPRPSQKLMVTRLVPLECKLVSVLLRPMGMDGRRLSHALHCLEGPENVKMPLSGQPCVQSSVSGDGPILSSFMSDGKTEPQRGLRSSQHCLGLLEFLICRRGVNAQNVLHLYILVPYVL